MFDEKHALLEVVKAIEELRERRGTTSKQICEFVRKRSKNASDPMKVLRTARRLNQLVDEGVLVKRGRRYMFPNSQTEEKLEAGDTNPVSEKSVELEDEVQDEDWLISDEESPQIEVPSKKRRVAAPKQGRKQNTKTYRRRKSDEAGPSFNHLDIERKERSRSPVKGMHESRDKSDLETIDKNEDKSKSQLSLTAQGTSDDHTTLENYRFESSSIPPPSNPQVPNVNRKNSCCDNDGEQIGADQEEEILMKIKHERENYRKSGSCRSSSKARERQCKKKERDELIEKGRIEKLNRRSFSPELDSIGLESSLCPNFDDNIA